MTTENIPHNIKVKVETHYVEGQSEPDNDRYVFSYTITISNEGGVPAKLLSRHWLITDANGHVQEVKELPRRGNAPKVPCERGQSWPVNPAPRQDPRCRAL